MDCSLRYRPSRPRRISNEPRAGRDHPVSTNGDAVHGARVLVQRLQQRDFVLGAGLGVLNDVLLVSRVLQMHGNSYLTLCILVDLL